MRFGAETADDVIDSFVAGTAFYGVKLVGKEMDLRAVRSRER